MGRIVQLSGTPGASSLRESGAAVQRAWAAPTQVGIEDVGNALKVAELAYESEVPGLVIGKGIEGAQYVGGKLNEWSGANKWDAPKVETKTKPVAPVSTIGRDTSKEPLMPSTAPARSEVPAEKWMPVKDPAQAPTHPDYSKIAEYNRMALDFAERAKLEKDPAKRSEWVTLAEDARNKGKALLSSVTQGEAAEAYDTETKAKAMAARAAAAKAMAADPSEVPKEYLEPKDRSGATAPHDAEYRATQEQFRQAQQTHAEAFVSGERRKDTLGREAQAGVLTPAEQAEYVARGGKMPAYTDELAALQDERDRLVGEMKDRIKVISPKLRAFLDTEYIPLAYPAGKDDKAAIEADRKNKGALLERAASVLPPKDKARYMSQLQELDARMAGLEGVEYTNLKGAPAKSQTQVRQEYQAYKAGTPAETVEPPTTPVATEPVKSIPKPEEVTEPLKAAIMQVYEAAKAAGDKPLMAKTEALARTMGSDAGTWKVPENPTFEDLMALSPGASTEARRRELIEATKRLPRQSYSLKSMFSPATHAGEIAAIKGAFPPSEAEQLKLLSEIRKNMATAGKAEEETRTNEREVKAKEAQAAAAAAKADVDVKEHVEKMRLNWWENTLRTNRIAASRPIPGGITPQFRQNLESSIAGKFLGDAALEHRNAKQNLASAEKELNEARSEGEGAVLRTPAEIDAEAAKAASAIPTRGMVGKDLEEARTKARETTRKNLEIESKKAARLKAALDNRNTAQRNVASTGVILDESAEVQGRVNKGEPYESAVEAVRKKTNESGFKKWIPDFLK